MPYQVSVIRCSSYDDALLAQAVHDALAPLGGLASVVHAGQRVLIKLNLLSAAEPERAVTTHPALVRVVVRMVQALGAVPVLGDSPGGVNTPGNYQALLKKTGMRQVIDETGCACVLFDEHTQEMTPKGARVFKKITAVTAPSEADVIISLPKLKTHQFVYYTGAVKTLYGFLPGLKKAEYHRHVGKNIAQFAELLLDIYETFPPALTIMDAVVGMEGQGPSSGTPRQVGLLLASRSGTALDYVMTELIGLHPLDVPTVRAAAVRGIGPKRLGEITLFGAALDAVRVPNYQQALTMKASLLPHWLANLSSWLFATRPCITPAKCLRCGKCAEVCPPHAIAFRKGTLPRIDHPHCLRCYCCHELCPADAIRVAPPLVSLKK